MNKEIFNKVEQKEDEILKNFEKLNDEIRKNIGITTGISKEFKECLINTVIETLSIVNNINTWERE